MTGEMKAAEEGAEKWTGGKGEQRKELKEGEMR